MKRHSTFQNDKATLYIVSTPIGNMQDISLRAIDVLKNVDLILAEDTRTSGVLLKHHDIDTPLKSYHAHNEQSMVPKVIDMLESSRDVALISDAGTPLLSDPGHDLVRAVREKAFNIAPIPGASALLSALVMSDLPTHPFTFYGFLPQKAAARDKILKTIRTHPHTMVFYESPNRIQKTLAAMHAVFGKRRVTIARELTKLYEETISLTLDEYDQLDALKGEIVLIVEGSPEIMLDEGDMLEHVELLIEDGMREMDAIKQVAKARNLKKNTVYMAFQKKKALKNDKE